MSLLKTFESKSIPGATFTLRMPGRKLRNRVEVDLCDVFHMQVLIAQQQDAIVPGDLREDPVRLQDRLNQLTFEEKSILERLKIQQENVNTKILLTYAEHMLESYALPGTEYEEFTTNEDLFEAGPLSFADEVISQSYQMWRITPAETKNS